MADDYVCPECAYTSDKNEACPFCETKLVKIDEGMDEYTVSEDYEQNDTSSATEDDFEPDMGELPNTI